MSLAWRIEFSDGAKKNLSKLDPQVAKLITKYMRERVSGINSPRNLGAALSGPHLSALWKYRVGDYRIICDIQDETVKILVVKVGHRSDVYN